jgi:hypothetical protein
LARLIGPRTRLLALIAGAGLSAGIGVTSACLTDPPPDLTSPSNLGPEIVHASLVPAEGVITQWPLHGEFVVPVRNVDPNNCSYSVAVGGLLPFPGFSCAGPVNNGVLMIDRTIIAPLDTSICAQPITFYVATRFISPSFTAYQDGQGDTAQWYYSPPSCVIYDAGAVQGGAFPEAAVDGFVVPESGAE